MLGMFIFTAILMTVIVGMFFGAIFTSGMENGWGRTILAIIIAVVIGCGISGLLCMERMGDITNWNNGYCTCGNEWNFKNVDHVKNGSNLYYWHCGNCGNVIELHSEFSK